jgi:DNA-binding beta-propeller fold protein YncE
MSWRPVASAQIIQTAMVAVLALSAGVSTVFVGRDLAARQALAAGLIAVQRTVTTTTPRPVVNGGVALLTGGDLFVADTKQGLIRRVRLRHNQSVRTNATPSAPTQQLVGTSFPFDAAADIALDTNGDLFVADPMNHRICRIDRPTGKVTTVAGTGGEGYDSEAKQAAQSPLRRPEAIAVSRNGDLYIADTLNNRVRVVSQLTGLIRTVAGEGEAGGPLGDGGPAVDAHLDTPAGIAVAGNGDIYIADTGHNRIRKVDAITGVITTRAKVTAPTGLVLVPVGARLFVYAIDSRNGEIRVIDPDGGVSTLAQSKRLVKPTRLAYSSTGWLYVKDESPTGVTAIPVPNPAHVELATARRHSSSRKAV